MTGMTITAERKIISVSDNSRPKRTIQITTAIHTNSGIVFIKENTKQPRRQLGRFLESPRVTDMYVHVHSPTA